LLSHRRTQEIESIYEVKPLKGEEKMEKKELREQYYKAVEKTIEITMDDFENLSDDFEKVDRLLYLGKIEDLVTSLICMGLFENQMYENLFVSIEQAKRKIKESMEEGE
jgi:hypothetical protein